LNHNVMGSTLNNYIVEYLEITSAITEEDPRKYLDVKISVEDCLKKAGWTSQGFYTTPQRQELLDALQKIYEEYFVK